MVCYFYKVLKKFYLLDLLLLVMGFLSVTMGKKICENSGSVVPVSVAGFGKKS